MQLKRLFSNKATFHTVEFKPGVNFIVGSAIKKNKKDTQKTYNGVGKSLLIKLIDFCLACESIEDFSDKLKDWEFTLEFEVNGKDYVSTRNTSKQQRIVLNGEEMTLDSFRDIFVDKVFGIKEPVNFLTWRTLISRFLRPRKESYVTFDTTSSKETPYGKLINTSYLLGLDIGLVQTKKSLKADLDRVDSLKESLEKDDIFKRYFTQGKDVDIETADLEDKIKGLKTTLESFNVSESYYEIQNEADKFKYDGQQIKNRITLLQNSLKQIEKTLDVKSDITPEVISKLYNEAKHSLKDSVIKTIKNVSEFHNNLMQERKKRLLNDKEQLLKELKPLEQKRKEIGVQLDDRLKFLGKHKALDEFVAVNGKLSSLQGNLDKLKAYKGLMQEYQNKNDEIAIAFREENIKTNNYLMDAQLLLEKNMNTFRLLSKRFYSDKAGGIEVRQNKGINQVRFDIDVQIDDDTSDGVNEVKIFCFDMALLLTKHNHSVRFILHDSRLYSNVDPRQRATLFRICKEYSTKEHFQYIATVNEDQIESVREHYTDKEYKQIIEDNKILNLTDESEESRLLGVQVNIDYER